MKNNPAGIALQVLIGTLTAAGLIVILVGVNHREANPVGITFQATDWPTVWLGAGLIAWALLTLIMTLAAAMAARMTAGMIAGPVSRHAAATDDAVAAPTGP